MVKAIDMRLRPPYKSYGTGNDTKTPEQIAAFVEALKPNTFNRGLTFPESVLTGSMEAMIKEMEQYDVVGVAPNRKISGGKHDDVIQLVADYPDRFIGIININPLNKEEALEEIDKYVINNTAKGVIIEHAWATNKEHFYITDERAFDVYEKLQEHNIPMMMTYGGMGVKNQDYYHPKYIDELATIFPKLKMILSHGGWPYVNEVTHLGRARANVYIQPDVYMMYFTPGAESYITAANYELQDRMLFGTAYPAMNLEAGILHYRKVLREEVVDKVLYKNALRLFGDEVVQASATGH